MPHQCIHCSEIYKDGSEELLRGCSKCSSKFFFYITQERLDKMKQQNTPIQLELTSKEKKQIEEDVREISGITEDEAPIVMDFESVKVLKPGKYLVNIKNLFSKESPFVYTLEDGKYIIDLGASLEKDI